MVHRLNVVKGSKSITGVSDVHLLSKFCNLLYKLTWKAKVIKCKMAVEKQVKRKKTDTFEGFMQINLSTFFVTKCLRLNRYFSPSQQYPWILNGTRCKIRKKGLGIRMRFILHLFVCFAKVYAQKPVFMFIWDNRCRKMGLYK